MGTQQNHQITVCTSCKPKGTDCRPGFDLFQRLSAASAAAVAAIPEGFDVAGVTCIAGCDRPCTVIFHTSARSTYLSGDIGPDEDIWRP
ncbi:DUF1636 family protein [Sulfitobacter sp. 1A12157]|uniref:DUF1636 family protein n=1 Tax=Sulfitobacter sp. 1A12157 TaxID=3368594 RepID=UPI003745D197